MAQPRGLTLDWVLGNKKIDKFRSLPEKAVERYPGPEGLSLRGGQFLWLLEGMGKACLKTLISF